MIENRTFDGSDNNAKNPNWGKAGEQLFRKIKSDYEDGVSKPSGKKRPNPRLISNIVCVVEECAPQHPELSNYMWAWGQYLDHQLDLSPGANTKASPCEDFSFKAPADDPDVKNGKIPLARTIFDPETGTSKTAPRQQTNISSSYMDSSNVYGSSCEKAILLRRLDGSGKLKSTESRHGELLPFNTMGIENDQGPLRGREPQRKFFVAGDFRSNEHNVLTCMHTLFMREHNRLCDEFAKKPDKQLKSNIKAIGADEAIYQRARRTVGAIEQAITYEEFLPALLGNGAIKPYKGYKEKTNATIFNVFSTVVYRLGHDMLSSTLLILPPDGKRAKEIELSDAFWNPERIKSIGIDGFLNGLAHRHMERVDGRTVRDIRSLLFNVFDPKSKEKQTMLMDLAALNIQRGRDHGIPDYNKCRVALGLKRKTDFDKITKDEVTISRLRKAYNNNLNLIDPWIGGLAETPHKNAIVGEFFFKVLKMQFEQLRDGDRFWYENDPAISRGDRADIKKTTLGDVIARNTKITDLGNDVFFVEES